MTEAWGIERVRRRSARRRKRIVCALVRPVLVSLLVPVLAWRAMRDADEVEREHAVGALAGAGVTALLLLPLLTAGQALFGIESPAMLAWAAALGTAIGLFVLRRWCG